MLDTSRTYTIHHPFANPSKNQVYSNSRINRIDAEKMEKAPSVIIIPSPFHRHVHRPLMASYGPPLRRRHHLSSFWRQLFAFALAENLQ